MNATSTSIAHQPTTPVRDEMPASIAVHLRDSVGTRILWLYGLFALLSNAAYLAGYYLLPEGSLRGSPWVAFGGAVAQQERFWAHFGVTLLINTAVLAFGVALNLLVVRGVPQGYLVAASLAIMGGLVAGSNSFAASDLGTYTAREGMALGLTVGGLEQLAFVLAIAATVQLGVYHYFNWYRLSEKATKVGALRAVRLTTGEWVTLLAAVVLLALAAYRETVMFFGVL
jgi:hypothetical protein